MRNQSVFKRYENKYLLTKQQMNEIKVLLNDYVCEDDYGRSAICNIYYDTSNNLLTRRSIEKPIYKEKFRIRSYGIAKPDSNIYVEIKRKHKKVVYKRRIAMKESEAMKYIAEGCIPQDNTQISQEINYFLSLYEELFPKFFLSYEREAFYSKNDYNFRLTFDENILWRDYNLSLCSGIYGYKMLPDDMALMEVKTLNAIPLWMTQILSSYELYKISFSKCGNAYKNKILLIKGA